jgi:hypothetical protein
MHFLNLLHSSRENSRENIFAWGGRPEAPGTSRFFFLRERVPTRPPLRPRRATCVVLRGAADTCVGRPAPRPRSLAHRLFCGSRRARSRGWLACSTWRGPRIFGVINERVRDPAPPIASSFIFFCWDPAGTRAAAPPRVHDVYRGPIDE